MSKLERSLAWSVIAAISVGLVIGGLAAASRELPVAVSFGAGGAFVAYFAVNENLLETRAGGSSRVFRYLLLIGLAGTILGLFAAALGANI